MIAPETLKDHKIFTMPQVHRIRCEARDTSVLGELDMRGIVLLALLLGPMASWAGYIEFHKTGFVRSDIQDLEAQIRYFHNRGDESVTIDLNSGGGDLSGLLGRVSIEQGLAHKIRQIKANGLKIITRVRGKSRCESACTALFALGDVRWAAPRATFMFHGVKIQKAGNRKKEFQKLYAERWLDVIGEIDYGLASYLDRENWFLRPTGDWTVSGRKLYRDYGKFINYLK